MVANFNSAWADDLEKGGKSSEYFSRRRPYLFLYLIIGSICLFVLFSNSGVSLPIGDKETAISAMDTLMSESLQSKQWPLPVFPPMYDIYNDTLGFQKILALNLPSRSDKRDRLTLSASFTNMSIEYIEGITGDKVPTKALPWGQEKRPMAENFIGSWRGHMNGIRKIVEERLGSALIVEDDVDWDIRIREQLIGLGVGVRALLNQTISHPAESPFGDGWDVLWLGHCADKDSLPGKGEFTIPYDPTTTSWENYVIGHKDYMKEWPAHSRRIRYTNHPLCTTAYAVSQQGARKLLWALAVKELKGNFDNALEVWCREGLENPVCLTSQPTYFYMYKPRMPAGKGSDNNPNDQAAEAISHTHNVRLSVANNHHNLLMGNNLTDYWPDDQKPGTVKNPY